MKTDIQNRADIELMVNAFYTSIRNDDLLGPIFNCKIKDQWDRHLDKMFRFWETVLLGEHTYHGSPFMPHAQLPVSAEHFDQWLKLFYTTVDSLFEGEKATRAKWQGQRMAEMFNSKIEYYRHNKATPLL